ncbi:uncharacterized protein LOC129899629 [Solanum dulcamara]|uniref:uncharacterized protein LOC129899629 n=1 Tax=Solanum dulcamara TaxID=45834 RepID=UPI0024869F75|nr:uncharacterized protein LOC129899629 [Solanum dulcamara]
MADTTTTISGDSIPIPDKQQSKPMNPLISFISSVLQLFKPPPSPPSKKIEPTAATSDPKPIVSAEEEEKPAVVKFPRQDLPSLKLESEGEEPNTNPIVLWQVYAIGGFFVLRWAWSRWNERRGNRKPSDEEPPPGQE